MSEERITETTDSNGNTHTTRVIHETRGGSSGGGTIKWAFLLVLVAALGVGGYALTQTNASEIAMNDAIADVANDVGDAAGQIGDAAEDAADALNGGE